MNGDFGKQQGDIKLAFMMPDIKQVFDIAGFTQLLNFSDSIEAASAHYRESR